MKYLPILTSISTILAFVLLTKTIDNTISTIIFALALIILGSTSRGFTNKNNGK